MAKTGLIAALFALALTACSVQTQPQAYVGAVIGFEDGQAAAIIAHALFSNLASCSAAAKKIVTEINSDPDKPASVTVHGYCFPVE